SVVVRDAHECLLRGIRFACPCAALRWVCARMSPGSSRLLEAAFPKRRESTCSPGIVATLGFEQHTQLMVDDGQVVADDERRRDEAGHARELPLAAFDPPDRGAESAVVGGDRIEITAPDRAEAEPIIARAKDDGSRLLERGCTRKGQLR